MKDIETSKVADPNDKVWSGAIVEDGDTISVAVVERDGRLVARACKRLGVTAAALAERIGAHEAVLSRARHGELPEQHREAIKALLKSGAGKAT